MLQWLALDKLWLIMLRAALPAVITAIKMHLGKEVIEAMNASIGYAAAVAEGDEDKKVVALAQLVKEIKDIPTAGAELVRQGMINGLPWFFNLLFEAMVGDLKITSMAAAESQEKK